MQLLLSTIAPFLFTVIFMLIHRAENDQTQPAIDNFLLNYPYFLLLNALLLFASERIFVAFAGPAGLKQKKLFDLIDKEGILGASGESEGKEKVIGGGSLEAVELKYGFQVT